MIISNVPAKPVTINKLFEGVVPPALGNSGTGVAVGIAAGAAVAVVAQKELRAGRREIAAGIG